MLFVSKNSYPRVLYRYTCDICNSVYIGKTKRHLLVRQYEHLGTSIFTDKALKYTEKDAKQFKSTAVNISIIAALTISNF